MRVVSLFSGCGGLDLGFAQEGFNIVWANDVLEDACSTYTLNLGSHIVCQDITEIDKALIPKADVLIGGPPCQSFSMVGKRNPEDKRSDLVFDYLKTLQQMKPKMFLFENVVGLLSAKDSEGNKVVDALTQAFGDIGYVVKVFKLNAANYGVPQRRKRIFILGSKICSSLSAPTETHSQEGGGLQSWVSVSEALDDLGEPTFTGESHYTSKPTCEFQQMLRRDMGSCVTEHFTPYASEKDMELMQYIPQGGNYRNVPDSIATKRILNIKKTGGRTTMYGRLSPNMPSYTINTYFNRPNGGCNIHHTEQRMISVREALRLQSFPDSFKLVSKSKRNLHVQVGNAVPPFLGRAWAKHLKTYL